MPGGCDGVSTAIERDGGSVRFLLGVVGGAAPEVIRVYGARTDPGSAHYLRTVFYWAITVAFLMVAGTVAVVMAADSHAAAFAAGIQTPFVVRGLEAAVSRRAVSGTSVEELTTSSASAIGKALFRLRRHIRFLRLG